MDDRLRAAALILSSLAIETYGRSHALNRLKEIGYTEQEALFILGILAPEPSRSTPQAMIEDTLRPDSTAAESDPVWRPVVVCKPISSSDFGKDPADDF